MLFSPLVLKSQKFNALLKWFINLINNASRFKYPSGLVSRANVWPPEIIVIGTVEVATDLINFKCVFSLHMKSRLIA